MAAGKGHLEVMKLLLDDERVIATLANIYLMRLAKELGDLEMIQLLVLSNQGNTNAARSPVVPTCRAVPPGARRETAPEVGRPAHQPRVRRPLGRS